MKKIIQLKCTNCGADLEITEKRDIIYCTYCGSKMLLNDENEYTYRYIDEADVKRAETEKIVKLKELEMKAENKKRKARKKLLEIVGCTAFFLVAILLFVLLPLFNSKKASEKQEAELQQIVNEVRIDVENEKFDDAYLKAKSIQYTENWSSEIEEKWDNIRKDLIDYIIQKEKEVTGKSKHKPEKNGFLHNLFQ